MKTTREVVGSFMADCQLRGLSPKTLRGYRDHVERLTELSPQFPPKPDVIQAFLATLTPHNADAYYRTFRALSNYAHKRYKSPNFMLSVTRPRVPKVIMPTITETELNLLAWALDGAPARDKAIVALFVDTAIRKGEAGNLKTEDIHDDRIIVKGKTGYRIVPISPCTRDLLLALPRHKDGFVFHGREGKPLGETGFYQVVRKYLGRVGYIGRQFGPQVLRRSFGVFHLKDGGDLKSLSLILGHSNISTTANYYTPLLAEDVIAIHQKHTPGRVFIS